MAEETKERGLVEYQSRDGQLVKLSFDSVRKYLVSGKAELVTDQEIVMYMGTCKARGLNPFKRDCYLVKYNQDPAATIVSIDYFRSRARAQTDCRGWECGVIVENGDQIIERKGSFMRPGDALLGAWFRARPAGWEVDFDWSINLDPYIKKKSDGGVTKFWADENQPQMIAKVVESQGLRRLWPDEFQGLYAEDDNLQNLKDVTPVEPIGKPKEIKSNEDTENRDHATTGHTARSGSDNAADAGRESGSGRGGDNSGPVDGGESLRGSRTPQEKPDKKAEALAWVAEAPEAEIMDSKTLNQKLKGLSQGEQLVVCSAFNKRRQTIVAELKAAGQE